MVGRLRAKATPEQAQAEMSAVVLELARDHPETDLDLGIHVIPLSLYLVGPRVRSMLVLFMGAVVLVLLIACANVAGLFSESSPLLCLPGSFRQPIHMTP